MLMLPWVAMRFTGDMDWDATDFLVFGAMLALACGTLDLTARMTGNSAYRAAVAVAVAGAFTLIWINLAVGIVGSEDSPANLMFGGVLAVAILGALVARLQPTGMARALSATAVAQALVGVTALAFGSGAAAPSFPMATVVLTGFFAALWLVSAWLFGKAGREQTPAGAAP